jgi:hypothetical protein
MESSLNLPRPCRRLPLEMNSEIFKCLKVPIQTKFIWGLGKGIYAMFGQKLLIKVWHFHCKYSINKNIKTILSCKMYIYLRPQNFAIPKEFAWLAQKTRPQFQKMDSKPTAPPNKTGGNLFLRRKDLPFLGKIVERTNSRAQSFIILNSPKCHHLGE